MKIQFCHQHFFFLLQLINVLLAITSSSNFYIYWAMVMMMIHDNDDTSTGPWQVSVDDYLQYGRSRPPCCSNALETWGSTWGSYRLINLIHVIHLGKLQVAADSAQLCNCATEKAATLYCHCMQLHATQGNSRKLKETQGNSLLNIFFLRRSRSTDTTTDTAFD